MDIERFWTKVDKNGPRWNGDSCWVWQGFLNNAVYGQFWSNGKLGYAHRFAYELLVGPIPPELTLDHLCRRPSCVRPAHLEPVTMRVNILRGEGISARAAKVTHCPSGHPYDLLNTYFYPTGYRQCRTCHRQQEATRWARKGKGD